MLAEPAHAALSRSAEKICSWGYRRWRRSTISPTCRDRVAWRSV